MGNLNEVFGGSFRPNEEEATTEFEALPAGTYPVIIEQEELKPNNAGNGTILKVVMAVVGDKFAGRKLYDNLNLIHPKEVAMQIARKRLAGLGQACNIEDLQDTSQLVGNTITVKVKVREDRPTDNDVIAYSTLNPAAPSTLQRPQSDAPVANQAPPPQATEGGGKMPWEK